MYKHYMMEKKTEKLIQTKIRTLKIKSVKHKTCFTNTAIVWKLVWMTKKIISALPSLIDPVI